jgi:FkbM family methyltransferase
MELGPSGLTLLARENDCSVNFCHTARARRYSNGVGQFLDSLHGSYLLDRVPLRPSDWVLDCGANVGEVSLALLRREPSLNIVAVEPEALEADCADLNLYQGRPRTVRGVLWHEETTLKFYSAAATADSSTIEPPKYDAVREVPATTVDALLTRMQCQRLRLLKLEAEGAEPEILQGAMGSLERIDYIAADLGPERGVRQEETATPVINLLLARGFEIVSMRFDRVVVLFRNRRAID